MATQGCGSHCLAPYLCIRTSLIQHNMNSSGLQFALLWGSCPLLQQFPRPSQCYQGGPTTVASAVLARNLRLRSLFSSTVAILIPAMIPTAIASTNIAGVTDPRCVTETVCAADLYTATVYIVNSLNVLAVRITHLNLDLPDVRAARISLTTAAYTSSTSHANCPPPLCDRNLLGSTIVNDVTLRLHVRIPHPPSSL